MTFRISHIYLYGKDIDKSLDLEFSTDSLNVITGASATGKSALLAIIDYCLGSGSFNIPTGVIRQAVSTYAIQLETEQGSFVCARNEPAANRATTSTMFIGLYDGAGPPDRARLDPNMDLAAAVAYLSQLAGITENVTSASGGSRREFTATIRHAMFFTLQSQGEVANPNILFHSQNEEFIPQAIRDVLPFFLGAIDAETIRKRERLRTVRREIRDLRRRLDENAQVRGASSRGLALISECQAVGLLDAQDQILTDDEIVTALSSAIAGRSDESFYDGDDSPTVMDDLLTARARIRAELSVARTDLASLRSLLAAHFDFNGAASTQSARLQSVGLLRSSDQGESSQCPICESQLVDPVPSVAALSQQLVRLDREVQDVRDNTPNLQALIGDAESRIQDASQRLRLNQDQVDSVAATSERIAELRDIAIQRASTRGRVSLYLESLTPKVEQGFQTERLEALLQEEADLVTDLDEDEVRSRLDSALARVSLHMSQVLEALPTEYSGYPARLDPRKLTVVVDTPSGPATLSELGSGANWLACHVAAFIGLHRYFVEQNRPVPRFLILDQPSQVYFPQDPATLEGVSDEDSRAVEQVFRVIYEFASMEPGFQVIIVDHADLPATWFSESVRRRWRGEGLIPTTWFEGSSEPH